MAKVKERGTSAPREREAFPWAPVLDLLMKLLELFLSKKQAEEVRKELEKSARAYGGSPSGDNATDVRTLLQQVYSQTKRARPFKRAWLRWSIDELPPCCNMGKPRVPAALLSEAKDLAAKDRG